MAMEIVMTILYADHSRMFILSSSKSMACGLFVVLLFMICVRSVYVCVYFVLTTNNGQRRQNLGERHVRFLRQLHDVFGEET